MTNLLRIESQARRELSVWQRFFAPELVQTLGPVEAQNVQGELDSELKKLLAMMPDPGWRAPQMRAFGLGGAIYLALYLVLARRGQTADQVWHICEQATRTRFSSVSWFQRKTMGWLLFSPLWKQMTKSIATKSAQAAVGGWVLDYVPPDPGSSDYGVTYHRCAIRDLAHAVGAEAFAPFICQSDAVMSELLGWGLRRTGTIAQGQSQCDFRFRKGQPTDVRSVTRLPVVR
jgi:hypothetical protein